MARAHGRVVSRYRLLRYGRDHLLVHIDGADGSQHLLRLTEHGNGVWFTSTGEALDLSCDPPTLGNIELNPERQDRWG